MAGDVVTRRIELAAALQHRDAYDIDTLTVAECTAPSRARTADLVVVMLDQDSAVTTPQQLASLAAACITAVLSPTTVARRLVLVHLLSRAEAVDPARFWLSEHVRGLARLAADPAEEAGIGVTLLRFVADDLGHELSWPIDVAQAVGFLDSLPLAVAVPELELAR